MKSLKEVFATSNPAWEIYVFLKQYFSLDESQIFTNDEILELYNRFNEPGIDPIESIRKNFIALKWCCAVPTPEVLSELALFSPVIEVGAGSGYWANQLSELGVNIIALDNGTDYRAEYFDVKQVDTFDFSTCAERTLLLIWPSDNLNWAHDLLNKAKWKKIIYIGEWRDGRMATSSFFDKIQNEFMIQKIIPMPRYPGWKDSCYILIRR